MYCLQRIEHVPSNQHRVKYFCFFLLKYLEIQELIPIFAGEYRWLKPRIVFRQDPDGEALKGFELLWTKQPRFLFGMLLSSFFTFSPNHFI